MLLEKACGRTLGNVGRSGRDDEVRLIAELAAQAGVALTPRLEALADGFEQTCFRRRLFLRGGAAEEAGAEIRIPADVVSMAHLILEESGQQQTLRACD